MSKSTIRKLILIVSITAVLSGLSVVATGLYSSVQEISISGACVVLVGIVVGVVGMFLTADRYSDDASSYQRSSVDTDRYADEKIYNISVNKSVDKQKLYEFITLLTQYVTPRRIRARQYQTGHGYKYFPKRLPEAFEEEFSDTDGKIHFSLDGDEFDFFITKERLDKNLRISLSIKYDLADKMFADIEKFIIEEAVFASESNQKDYLNQNSRTIYTLESGEETEDPDSDGIRGVEFEPITKDFQKYPGYRFKTYGYGLGAFYRMWFGKEIYAILNKDALRKFRCYENIVLENDVTRITLYENISDYDKKANRKLQLKFRKALNIDQIAAQMRQDEAEEMKRNADPEVNIQEGNFEHGGVRLIQTYLRNGEVAHRSEADSVEEIEMDENGKEVFRITRDINELNED